MKVAVLAGNPKPQSRTLRIAETMVETLLGSGPHETTVIDLAVHSSHVFE
jgi:FMN reductase